MSNLPVFAQQFAEQLNIRWEIEFAYGSTDRPSIISSKKGQYHQITMPYSYQARALQFRCDYAHELIHCSFAEALDQIFAAIYLDKTKDYRPKLNAKLAREVYHAQQLIDVWVADRMNLLNPQLVAEDVDTFLQAALQLPEITLREMGRDFIVGFAINAAQISRQGLAQYQQAHQELAGRLPKILGSADHKIAEKLAKHFTSLPLLPDNLNDALKAFATATIRSAEILRLDAKPRLKYDQEEDVWFWTF